MRKFREGDVVKLKSDGRGTPPMIVVGYVDSMPNQGFEGSIARNNVRVSWRHPKGRAYEKDYPEDLLELIDEQIRY